MLAALFKKRLWHKCFPVNFVKFRRTSFFFIEHLWTTASEIVFHIKSAYFCVHSSFQISAIIHSDTFSDIILNSDSFFWRFQQKSLYKISRAKLLTKPCDKINVFLTK